ncbi:MAG: type II secretion system minor pseudopilin GspK [Pseudomonadota bacterium]
MFRLGTRARGVALISVLLVVAILMAITSRLMARHNLVINQHQNTFETDQALHYALGAETLAIQALVEDFTRLGVGVDHNEEIWAQQVLPFELDEGGFVEAQLRDMNGCFNVTSLADGGDAEALKRMKQMLRLLELPEQLAESMKDWVDGDQEITGFGAEDSEYLLANPPHRTPNTPIFNVSEFNLLRDVEPEMMARLLPHICALPDGGSTININTVNTATLAALDESLSLEAAEAITSAPRAYTDVKTFIDSHTDMAPLAPLLGVESNYFRLHAQAQVGDALVTLESVLLRDTTTGQVTVLQRDFGKLFVSQLQLNVDESS